MRIGCFGNMNNMLFSLARYLRDSGHDVKLFLEHDLLDHFYPDNDSFDESYKNYVFQKKFEGSHAAFMRETPVKEIRSWARDLDFIIVCGTYLAHLQKAGIEADVYWPHGSDLFTLPFLGEDMRIDQIVRNYYSYKLFSLHKRGIKKAHCINHDRHKPEYKAVINRLGISEKTLFFSCPMVYHPQYSAGVIEQYYSLNPHISLFRKLRAENDLLILNQNQQSLTTPVSQMRSGFSGKGTEVLIEGFADFVKKTKAKTHLVSLEYGPDVEKVKQMVSDLGIADYVTWLPKMGRKHLMVGLSFSDFGIGQYTVKDAGGNTTWEAFSMGKPLLHYFEQDLLKNEVFNHEFPAINLKRPHEISEVFSDFILRPDKYKEIGEKGANWYVNVFVKNSLKKYNELIEVKARGGNIENYVKQLVRESSKKESAILDQVYQ